MNKPVKVILIVVATIAVIVVGGNMVKADIHVERTQTIHTTLEALHKQTTDFTEFDTWSPWKGIDPNATAEIKGPQGEVGAEMHWSGNDEVGTGYQKVTSIEPNRIDLELVFTAPWESQSSVYYEFKEQVSGVDVTWGYDGDMPLLMSLFMDMDEMLGSKYEQGLTSLKAKLEE